MCGVNGAAATSSATTDVGVWARCCDDDDDDDEGPSGGLGKNEGDDLPYMSESNAAFPRDAVRDRFDETRCGEEPLSSREKLETGDSSRDEVRGECCILGDNLPVEDDRIIDPVEKSW